MKQTIIALAILLGCISPASAIDNNTVEVVYSGTTATVTVADNISSYVTVSSDTSADVVISQSNTAAVDDDEITYVLSGSTTEGSFKLSGSYKCTVSLAGVSITNSDGPALNILNGKRIKISAKKETTNTLTGAGTSSYNGCIYCKGHIEFQGNGELNIVGTAYHAVKAKEYVQIKNLTLNITSATKDGINCKEYFWMKSGTVTISGVGSDGIDVSMDGTTSTGEITATDTIDAHDDEDSGNFYQDGGTLTITLASSNTTGSLIQADGTIAHNGGTYNGTSYETAIRTIDNVPFNDGECTIYDLQGRKIVHGTSVNSTSKKGLYIINRNNKTTKVLVK